MAAVVQLQIMHVWSVTYSPMTVSSMFADFVWPVGLSVAKQVEVPVYCEEITGTIID